MELGHILVGEHVKLNHQQLFNTIIYIITVWIIQIVIQATWNRVMAIFNKGISRLQRRISNLFTRHHDWLFNNSYQPRKKVKRERTSTKYIIHNGRIARKGGKHARGRALIMIAMSRLARGTKIGKLN